MNFRLLAEDCVEYKDKIFFCSTNCNVIFSLNRNDKRIVLESCIPEEGASARRLSSKLLIWKESIIFVPMNSKKMWIWDISNNKWSSIDIPTLGVTKNRFFQACIYGDYIYMIGCATPAIVCVDMTSHAVKMITSPFSSLLKRKRREEDIIFRTNYVRLCNFIYLASCVDNSVIEFNLETEVVKIYSVGNKENRYSGIIYDGKYFWLCPRYEAKVFRWEKDLNELVAFDINISTNEKHILGGICKINEKQFLLAAICGGSIIFSEHNGVINSKSKNSNYLFAKKEYDHIYMLDDNSTYTEIYREKRSDVILEIDREKLWRFIRERRQLNVNFCIQENKSFELQDYIKVIG
ncbi:hypothetical protein [Butyrivibrio sp. LB2008]|uniref:hypothetical protein n=1 Tax=Butyrivibrio sp. LB2008 TaxID=1408305 RepID=UPI00047C6B52|nr:hypothetical protein [Butyrivibrio sp. LB2008]